MKQRVKPLRISLLILAVLFSVNVVAQDYPFGIFALADQSQQVNAAMKSFPSAYPEVMEMATVKVVLPSAVTLDDIKKTEVQDSRIVLYFTYKGAKKWAKFTKEQTGNQMAMVLNNKVYCMPRINAEIKNGMAMFVGLKDNEEAKQLNKVFLKPD